jgi:hypothetical protein
MKYFDNEPFLDSLAKEGGGSNKGNGKRQIALMIALVTISGLSFYLGMKLYQKNGQIAIMSKEVEKLRLEHKTTIDRDDVKDA